MIIGDFIEVTIGNLAQLFLHDSFEETGDFVPATLVSDDLMITAEHVLNSGETRFDFTNEQGITVEGEVVYTDPILDIALIQLDNPVEGLDPIKLNQASEIFVNMGIDIYGYPANLSDGLGDQKVSYWGNIYSQSIQFYPDGLFYDYDTEPGSSGSPVLDINGDLVAIHTTAYGGFVNGGTRITSDIINLVAEYDAKVGIPTVQPSTERTGKDDTVTSMFNNHTYKSFYTNDQSTIDDLLKNPDWEIADWNSLDIDIYGEIDVHMIYNRIADSFYYSTDELEVDFLLDNNDHLDYMGVQFGVDKGEVSSYFNPDNGDRWLIDSSDGYLNNKATWLDYTDAGNF